MATKRVFTSQVFYTVCQFRSKVIHKMLIHSPYNSSAGGIDNH